MTGIRFIPAQVKTLHDERPDACKYCGSQILAQRGAVEKSVTDLYEDTVTVVRCRRSDCESAFRRCPDGVDRGGQTQRMRGARVGARRKQDKAQDGQGVQERRLDAELVWAT